MDTINSFDSISLQISGADKPEITRFKHKAMATIFEIYIVYDDVVYSEQAAEAAFAELDRLELELSRFIENSDISRINSLKKDDSVVIGPDAFSCLKTCSELYLSTEGIFDITGGSLYDSWKYPDKKNLNTESGTQINQFPWLYLDEKNFIVKKANDLISLDLGGFGKGYAIDIMSESLREWDIKNFLINGGMSTVYADSQGDISWPVSLSDPLTGSIVFELNLKGRALSGSGLAKGTHIINPATRQPVKGKRAAWAFTENAAVSDALSTSFMIMTLQKIENYCHDNKDTGALVIPDKDKEECFKCGNWPD